MHVFVTGNFSREDGGLSPEGVAEARSLANSIRPYVRPGNTFVAWDTDSYEAAGIFCEEFGVGEENDCAMLMSLSGDQVQIDMFETDLKQIASDGKDLIICIVGPWKFERFIRLIAETNFRREFLLRMFERGRAFHVNRETGDVSVI